MRFKPVGLILVVMMVVPLLLSCTSATTPSTPQATTKPYGTLNVAVNFRGGTLDPAINTPNTLQTLSLGIFDSLVELTSDAKPRPGIAEKWEISADGKAHTFFIRKGVKFHDGTDLTGADVKFSLDRILAPDATHQDAASWRPIVDSVVLKDDFTVVMNLKTPLFELLAGFTNYAGNNAIVSKKYIETKGVEFFRANPIGSGPWKVVKYVPGARLELEANENHWRVVPKFKNLNILSVPEEGTKVAMLKTGELDIADIAPDSAPALKAAGLRVLSYDGGAQYFTMVFYDMDNPKSTPLGDANVRKAISLAVDKKELATSLYGGYAEPSAFFFAPRSAFFFDPNVLKVDPFDPEGAKKLMSDAGYPSGFTAKVWDLGAGGILSIFNQALSGYLRKAGINASIEAIDQAALSKISQPKPQPAAFNTLRPQLTGGGIYDFEKMYMVYHSTKASTKIVKNTKLDELIDSVPVTQDAAQKKKIALDAALMAKNEYALIPFLDMRTLVVLSSQVGDWKPIPMMTGWAASFEFLQHAK